MDHAVRLRQLSYFVEATRSGSLIELPTERPLPGYPVGILHREGAELTATAQLFIAGIKATAARLRAAPAAPPPARPRPAARRRK
jgi:hypothetical protein